MVCRGTAHLLYYPHVQAVREVDAVASADCDPHQPAGAFQRILPQGERGKMDQGFRARIEERDRVPVVVVLYHREEETRQMFEQLARVTDNYSLIIVDNGFGDEWFIESLSPHRYVRNENNTGTIRAMNQGLELAEGPYVAVLHSDLFIYDEGWLDHIIRFMETRDDVGLVGLAGRHAIREDGLFDAETTMVNMRGYPSCYIPTWRFTEVATIDGLGWVMRNDGKRLEEDFGMMHYYDLDLSLQYIASGSKVYVAAIDVWHTAQDEARSARSDEDYLRSVGGDDEDYYEEVREKFRRKWSHVLPIWRGYRDEALIDVIAEENRAMRAVIQLGKEYAEKLEDELRSKVQELERESAEIARGSAYARLLEADVERLKEELRLARAGGDENKEPDGQARGAFKVKRRASARGPARRPLPF